MLQIHRDTSAADHADKLLDFLITNKVKTLNIAGPNATSEPQVGDFVRKVLEEALFYRLAARQAKG